MEIPNITEAILENLEPISAGSQDSTTKTQEPDSPIQECSPSEYQNFQNASLDCTYNHPPSSWYQALATNKQLFPWLFDLNQTLIHQKHHSETWNWELLIRKISQTTIHEPNDKTLTLPVALRNRRRIWRLLEEARVDDVAGPEGQAMAERREEQRKKWTGAPRVELPPGFGGPSGFSVPLGFGSAR